MNAMILLTLLVAAEPDFNAFERRLSVVESKVAIIETRLSAIEPAKKSPTVDCDCGPDCVCPICRCKPAEVPKAQPPEAAVTGTDAPLSITVKASDPPVVGYVCTGNVCRPMTSGEVQKAYREVQSLPVYEVPKRGLFGRRKWR